MFSIRYEQDALRGIARLTTFVQRRIFDEAHRQLTHTPTTPSRHRKQLNGIVPPWDHVPPVWELRVGTVRVFYDVDTPSRVVIVRAVRVKGTKTTGEIL